jgi:hypothetical protein
MLSPAPGYGLMRDYLFNGTAKALTTTDGIDYIDLKAK